jgi:hypothetical protein
MAAFGMKRRYKSQPGALQRHPAPNRSGTSLDPVPLKASKHDEVPYFEIYVGDDLDEGQLVSWIEQASNLPSVAI